MSEKSEVLSPEALAQIATQCACANFRKASRAVTQYFDERLEPTGLRSTQFVILIGLGALEPTSIARLARELVMDPSTLARNLRPLEKQGLVEKSASAGRRRVNLSLTTAGREMLTAGFPLWREAQDKFVEALGSQTWNTTRMQLSQAVVAAREADQV